MDVFVLLDGFSFMLFVKMLVVLLITVYLAFALLMMRQISAMTKAVQMQDDYIIRGLGIMHFGFALLVWILAILARATQ
jgi:hypothetical protein